LNSLARDIPPLGIAGDAGKLVVKGTLLHAMAGKMDRLFFTELAKFWDQIGDGHVLIRYHGRLPVEINIPEEGQEHADYDNKEGVVPSQLGG